MKKSIFVVIALILMVGQFALSLEAQGNLYVSNLGQTPTGSTAVGGDSWVAQLFVTGNSADSYTLNSIQLLMGGSSGIPSGFTVSVYNSYNGLPVNSIGSLNGSDPLAGGIFTYAASDITLLPSTAYDVVVSATTPVAQGSYDWIATFGPHGGIDHWIISGAAAYSTDGVNWGIARDYTFQLAIYATPVPEPSVISLMLLGAGVLICMYRLKKHAHV